MPVSSLPLFLPLLLLLNALPFTLPLSLPPRDTGPIPITNPVGGWPAAQSVTFNLRSFGLDPSSQPAVSDCLTAYSMGRFYDGASLPPPHPKKKITLTPPIRPQQAGTATSAAT